jgi:hypothetical protein
MGFFFNKLTFLVWIPLVFYFYFFNPKFFYVTKLKKKDKKTLGSVTFQANKGASRLFFHNVHLHSSKQLRQKRRMMRNMPQSCAQLNASVYLFTKVTLLFTHSFSGKEIKVNHFLSKWWEGWIYMICQISPNNWFGTFPQLLTTFGWLAYAMTPSYNFGWLSWVWSQLDPMVDSTLALARSHEFYLMSQYCNPLDAFYHTTTQYL